MWVLFSRASALCAAVLLGFVASGEAKVFYSKSEALHLAFPNANGVKTENFFLTADQVKQVEVLAKTSVESKLVTVHVGYTNAEILGYAFIETHIVRTLPETFLIVLSPDGTLQKLLVLAFYEPLEYMPSDRWLAQFDQQALSPTLQLRQDIHGIMGATLTARAVTSGVRKVLALFQVLIQEKQ